MKKGQVSIEYILLIGFVFAILIPLTSFAFTSLSDFKEDVKIKQAEAAVNMIKNEAESIYYLGSPSMSTLEVYFPEGVTNLTIASNTINAKVQTKYGVEDVIAVAKVNLSGAIPFTRGKHLVKISAEEDHVQIS